jgi:small-conductance mechanosensitive channel
VIEFPNSNVLGSAVYNYSWPLFPYIWNEIKFNVAYESDLEFVSETVRRIATEEIGEAMLERVRTSRSLFSKTPVDQLEVREYPAVLFRRKQQYLAGGDCALSGRAQTGRQSSE